ncbi:MAG: hypothetical protein JWP18_408 [Solirubrobacterales bacterium]|jgi:hypothetical protein|nr:hypothetical protein [Solirubrobacterales bacterium]
MSGRGAAVRSGVWQHSKGQLYLVLGVGRFDEDDDVVVIYVRLYPRPGGQPISVRRQSVFLEEIEWPDGVRRPRFVFVGETDPAA